MNSLWSLTIDEYLEICDIARENGVQPGESMEPYIMAYMQFKNKKPIGHTELTKEEYIKEIISKGKTVLKFEDNELKIIKKEDKNDEKN